MQTLVSVTRTRPTAAVHFFLHVDAGTLKLLLSRKGSTLFSCGLALILYPILKYETSLILATRMLFKDIYCACRNNYKWKLNSSFSWGSNIVCFCKRCVISLYIFMLIYCVTTFHFYTSLLEKEITKQSDRNDILSLAPIHISSHFEDVLTYYY